GLPSACMGRSSSVTSWSLRCRIRPRGSRNCRRPWRLSRGSWRQRGTRCWRSTRSTNVWPFRLRIPRKPFSKNRPHSPLRSSLRPRAWRMCACRFSWGRRSGTHPKRLPTASSRNRCPSVLRRAAPLLCLLVRTLLMEMMRTVLTWPSTATRSTSTCSKGAQRITCGSRNVPCRSTSLNNAPRQSTSV
ncbi:unnamed protein product, partial [Prorocentrum cordatum]